VNDPSTRSGLSRRTFLVNASVPSLAAAAAVASSGTDAPAATTADRMPAARGAGPHPVPVSLTVNGRRIGLTLEPRVTLLDALREYAQLTGTKKGCDQGTCGACTVLVNGRRIDSCLTLAIMHENDRITTIEGLADGDTLHPMQAAFLEHDGFQCGYCTPGQIVSAVGLLGEKRPLDDASVREFMSGNICRCGAYKNIVAAVQTAGGGHG
jgi:xanthine dehydrogenase YagT iron-sulfur-binding subunit